MTTSQVPTFLEYIVKIWNPQVRGYTLATLAGLGIMLFVLFQQAALTGMFLVVVFGSCGLLLRRTSCPLLAVAMMAYSLMFPTGIPWLGANYARIPGSFLHLGDIILVAAVLTYLTAQYRLYALTALAWPQDRPIARKSHERDQPLRPVEDVREDEFYTLGILLGCIVVLGQLLWYVFTQMEFELMGFPHLRWVSSRGNSPMARLVLFAVVLGSVVIPFTLVMWYRRYRNLTGQEAGMMLLDSSWSEHRREAARLETWRIWATRDLRKHPPLTAWRILRTLIMFLIPVAAIMFVIFLARSAFIR